MHAHPAADRPLDLEQLLPGLIAQGLIAQPLADQVLSFVTMTVVPDGMLYRTTNLHVNFLRVVRTQPLKIEARVVAQTRQMITVRAEFRRQDGELIAEASAQQFLMTLEHWPAEREALETMAKADAALAG